MIYLNVKGWPKWYSPLRLSETRAMTASSKFDRPPLAWERDVPILTHPAVLRTWAALWIVTAAIMLALVGGIVGVREGVKAVAPVAALVLLTTGGMVVVSTLALLLVFGNRMRMAFAIDARGIVARLTDTRARTANRLAAVLGIFFGRPGVAGAGIIAVHGEERSVVWSGIAEARYDPRRYTITLRNAWRPVLYVFCTPEIYEEAAARIAAGIAGTSRSVSRRGNPLWSTLGFTLLVVLATLPLFGMPYPFEADLFAVIFTLCFALATIWLVPLMGWPVLGGVAWIAATVVIRGFATRTNQFSGMTYSGFESLDGGEWIGMLVAFVGLAVLASVAVAALRGHIPSLLMRDTLEMEGSNG